MPTVDYNAEAAKMGAIHSAPAAVNNDVSAATGGSAAPDYAAEAAKLGAVQSTSPEAHPMGTSEIPEGQMEIPGVTGFENTSASTSSGRGLPVAPSADVQKGLKREAAVGATIATLPFAPIIEGALTAAGAGGLATHAITGGGMGFLQSVAEDVARGENPVEFHHLSKTAQQTVIGMALGTLFYGAGKIGDMVTGGAKPSGIIKQALGGENQVEKVEQPIAQQGARAAAKLGPEESFRKGVDVETPFKQYKELYRQVDEATGSDFDKLSDKLEAAEDRARLAGSGSPEEAKAELEVKSAQDNIQEAEQRARESGMPDVDKVLKQAKAKVTETQANKDLNAKFYQSNSVVQGNVAHGAPESFNVKNGINVLENLSAKTKFGAPRLEQTSLGKEGAFALKQAFYDAQKAGLQVISRQQLLDQSIKILKYTSAGAGVFGLFELLKSH